MERMIEQGILYDFYGPLLTEHQQRIYEAVVYDNLSLGEIAAEEGISRQGVHDLIKRCDKILEEYESRLHLIERFSSNKKKLMQIKTLAAGLNMDLSYNGNGKDDIEQVYRSDQKKILVVQQEINQIIDDIIEEL